MRNLVRIVSGLVVSAVLLWLAFRQVDLDAMWRQLGRVDHRYTLLFAVALVVIQLCRILRWDELIRPFATVSRGALFRISSLGLMLILLLPLRLGEFARPYLLKKETGAPLSSGVGAVVIERVIDGLLVTLLFFVTTLGLEARYEVPKGLWVAALGALGLFSTALVLVVGTMVARQSMWRLLERVGRPLSPRLTERVQGMLDAFVSGLQALPDAGAVVRFVLWTLVYWGANGMGMYAMMLGFGWQLPPMAGFILVCVLVIGIMIPAGPGFLGTYQGALLAGLAIFGIGPTEAAAYGMLVYPLTLTVVVGFGLPFVFLARGQVTEIVRASAAQQAKSNPA